uniref:Uncharacterized protein n=1 Tax=Ursus americanus TaxID=9643 RepID=A0A452QG63_URSAM
MTVGLHNRGHSLQLSPWCQPECSVRVSGQPTWTPIWSFYTFVEEVIECFQNTVSIEELHFLLTDHEAWDRFVAEATSC